MILVQLIFILTLLLQSYENTAIEKYRLPTNIRPINYELQINVNPHKKDYTGVVNIILEVLNGNGSVLFLHADHSFINIHNITLNQTICNFSLFENPDTQIVPINCPTPICTGDIIQIHYTGKFSNEMVGFYKSQYDGDKILIATQFQPVYARRAFPCFDEPSFKATFDISVIHPRHYNALSNSPFQIAHVNKHETLTKFDRTPKMSTYLVAVVVSNFKSAIQKDQDFNVFARNSATCYLEIAKRYGEQLYDAMGEKMGIKYNEMGNPQKYLVAIPDFAAGAMENWGLINFRELDLLDDGNNTSSSTYQRVITVMAHEIAHQWFGNYVTLDWWSNTWLNEGFADYFGKIISNKVNNGTLELDKQFIVEVTQRILQKDAVQSAPALSASESSIKTAIEIGNKFDEITYLKGASIIHMMKHILGEETFYKGIQSYLNENKYSNTNPSILLKTLQKAAGNTVQNFEEKMQNWIYESGFPLVTVKQTAHSSVTLSQERFCITKNCTSTTNWYVPISYTTGKEKNFSANIKYWLNPNSTLEFSHNQKDWLIVNVQERGYYRVNYDEHLWVNIIKALLNKTRESIHPLNRAQLIDDVFQIARIGKVDYGVAFKLVQYLKYENSYYPWVAAIRSFSYIIDNVDSDTEVLLKDWLLGLIGRAFPKSINPISHIDHLKQSEISSWSCRLGQKTCLLNARIKFEAYKNGLSLDPEKKYTTLCYGMMVSNTESDFRFLLEKFKTASPQDQFNILLALGCMRDEELLTQYLNLTLLENSPIRQQDFPIVFTSVYINNKSGVKVALSFMEKNFKMMELAYGGGTVLSFLMLDIAEKISTPEDIAKMNYIMSIHSDNEIVQISAPSIKEVMRSNQVWQTEYGFKIQSIFKKQNNRSTILSYSTISLILASILILLF